MACGLCSPCAWQTTADQFIANASKIEAAGLYGAVRFCFAGHFAAHAERQGGSESFASTSFCCGIASEYGIPQITIGTDNCENFERTARCSAHRIARQLFRVGRKLAAGDAAHGATARGPER